MPPVNMTNPGNRYYCDAAPGSCAERQIRCARGQRGCLAFERDDAIETDARGVQEVRTKSMNLLHGGDVSMRGKAEEFVVHLVRLRSLPLIEKVGPINGVAWREMIIEFCRTKILRGYIRRGEDVLAGIPRRDQAAVR
jgi:hypothetical protein